VIVDPYSSDKIWARLAPGAGEMAEGSSLVDGGGFFEAEAVDPAYGEGVARRFRLRSRPAFCTCSFQLADRR
jgi:hypothetical protein